MNRWIEVRSEGNRKLIRVDDIVEAQELGGGKFSLAIRRDGVTREIPVSSGSWAEVADPIRSNG